MGVVPADKAGVGSAVNDATRELGGALGVAVIGSVYASLYHSGLDSTGVTAPALHATAARESIGAAINAARQLGSDGDRLLATCEARVLRRLPRRLPGRLRRPVRGSDLRRSGPAVEARTRCSDARLTWTAIATTCDEFRRRAEQVPLGPPDPPVGTRDRRDRCHTTDVELVNQASAVSGGGGVGGSERARRPPGS